MGELQSGAIVSRNDDCDAIAVYDFREQLEDRLRGARIELGGRLVSEHEWGLMHQRPCDCNSLLLAAGHLVRPVAKAVGETHGIEHFEGPLLALLPTRPNDPKGQLNVLLSR